MNIINTIFNFFKNLFNGVIDWIIILLNKLLSGLGDIILQWLIYLCESFGLNIEIPANVFDIVHELFLGIGYILPMKALLPIPLFMVAFYIAKLIFAIYSLIAKTIIRRVSVKVP